MIKKGDVVMWSDGADWRDGANHPKYIRGIIKDIYEEKMFDMHGNPYVYKVQYLVQPEGEKFDQLMSYHQFKVSNEPNDILKGML